ncbi:hypothetical protein pb186bvf_012082 [Paramecium bursaria]
MFQKYFDQTNMKRPQFLQVQPIENMFEDSEELPSISSQFDHLTLDLSNEIAFCTQYGNINGILQFHKHYISFKPDNDHLKDILSSTTIRKDKELAQEIVDKFSFKIYLDDIHFAKIGENKTLQIFLFGVLAVDPPLKDSEGQISMVRIQLQDSGARNSVAEPISKIVGTDLNNQGSIIFNLCELFQYLLKLEYYRHNNLIYSKLLKQVKAQETPTVQMNCLSRVTQYELIAFKNIQSNSQSELQISNYLSQRQMPTLNNATKILTQSQFEQIYKELPLGLSHKWYLLYSHSVHGVAFDSMLKRCQYIEENIIIIKGNHIFGAFMQKGWFRSLEYYGGTSSFLFTFKKHFKIYPYKQSKNIQRVHDSICIGEEDHPAIQIPEALDKYTCDTSATFQNEELSESGDLIELEIWGVQQNCDEIIRQQRLESFDEYFSVIFQNFHKTKEKEKIEQSKKKIKKNQKKNIRGRT